MALAACGSNGGAPASRSTGGTAPPGRAEASKAPERILADASAALRQAHGYEVQGTLTENGQQLRLDVTVHSKSSMRVTFSVEGESIEVLMLPTSSYLRANRAFWTTHFGPNGGALAGRWVQVQPANARALTSSFGHFAPETLSRCIVEDHGSLSIGGTATVDGRTAVIVKDAGDAPGSSPSTLAVASSGPPYPLRAMGTGPSRPGGHIDVCNDGKGTDVRGTLIFSRFGAVKPLVPPADVVRPGSSLST